MSKRVVLFNNIAPHYRDLFWRMLVAESDFEFHIFFGKPSKKGVKEIDFNAVEWSGFQDRIHRINNIRVRNHLIYQIGVVKEILIGKWDVFIFVGDMHVLSSWIAAIIARIRRKPVVLHGHGLYGSESPLKLYIRKLFLSLANKHLIYGNFARKYMLEAGIKDANIHIVYNSLDYEKHLQLRNKVIDAGFYEARQFFKNPKLPILVYIGRITAQKKMGLLLQTVKEMNIREDLVNLMLIGGGQIDSIDNSLSGKMRDTIHIFGPCYDESEIGKLVANADLCISPGPVGLTVVHSLSFGTPVITHNNFRNQKPEFESIEEGVNGAFFEDENLESLKATIRKWLDRYPKKDAELMKNCYKVIDTYYNPQYQMSIHKKALL